MIKTSRSARPWTVLLQAAALLAMLTAPVMGATFTVNSTDDAHDMASGDGNCATATAQCTLRAAIEEANSLGGTNTIDVPAGTYGLTLGVLKTTNTTNNLTINGTGAPGTVIVDGGALSGIFNFSGGAITVNNLTIQNGMNGTNNLESFGICTGGGIFVANATTVTITASVIKGNQTPHASGGGICVAGGGTLNLSNSTLRDNVAPNGGGGIRVLTDGTAIITQSTFSGNQVSGFGGAGGGIENQGTLQLTNSTVSGNIVSAGTGGGISVESGGALLSSVTITGNTGEGQLGVFGGSTVVESSIIANPVSGPNCFFGTSLLFSSIGSNLESANSCRFTVPSDKTNVDPHLGPLAKNGGPTRTHALQASSPAFNAADPGLCPSTDQRGVARPPGVHCDIGAYQVRRGAPLLLAATLPTSRSVQVGSAATAFASIINQGPGIATGCAIFPVQELPAGFSFQTTDSSNHTTGNPDTPATIVEFGVQSFVFAFTPAAPIAPTDVQFTFVCDNADAAPIVSGLNTELLSASLQPVPDIVALAVADPANPGVVVLSPTSTSASGALTDAVGFAGAFAVATVNVGIVGDSITVSADTGSAALPTSIALCETVPATGLCKSAILPAVTTQIAPNATPTFGIFVSASGPVPFDPANNRVFVRFKDSGGVTRGSTSVAVRTQ